MKIKCIFAERGLYAFIAPESEDNEDEFESIFDKWTDVEYLEGFFEVNKHLLNDPFYDSLSVEQAIRQTLADARSLQKLIIGSSVQGKLDDIFQPLENSEYRQVSLLKSKAYGTARKSWLRIYAIKIDDNLYVITGGAIKLTATMSESIDCEREHRKLKRYRDFLREELIMDEDSFKELEIIHERHDNE